MYCASRGCLNVVYCARPKMNLLIAVLFLAVPGCTARNRANDCDALARPFQGSSGEDAWQFSKNWRADSLACDGFRDSKYREFASQNFSDDYYEELEWFPNLPLIGMSQECVLSTLGWPNMTSTFKDVSSFGYYIEKGVQCSGVVMQEGRGLDVATLHITIQNNRVAEVEVHP